MNIEIVKTNPTCANKLEQRCESKLQFRILILDGKEAAWSGNEMPHIGDPVKVKFNGLGTGKIIGFFIEGGFLGCCVKPDEGQRPDWHIKQNEGRNFQGYMVFGAEIKFQNEMAI